MASKPNFKNGVWLFHLFFAKGEEISHLGGFVFKTGGFSQGKKPQGDNFFFISRFSQPLVNVEAHPRLHRLDLFLAG